MFTITPEKYSIKLFSLNSFCVDLYLETKNYSDDNKSIAASVGIALNKGVFHTLRQYGKYAKVGVNKLEGLSVNN